MSAEHVTRGRDLARSRPRAARVLVPGVVVTGLLGAVVYAAAAAGPTDGNGRSRDDLVAGWVEQAGDVQVLGGEEVAGRPTVQRRMHDGVQVTVSVAPARPGPNLVRVDTLEPAEDGQAGAGHAGHVERGAGVPVRIGTTESDRLVRARPRPGVDGLWAVVRLPAQSGTLLVSHGPEHRIPFVVSTGNPAPPHEAVQWTGPDGPECLARATGALVSGSAPTARDCPAESLGGADRDALTAVVRTLADRGVRELAVAADASPRSTAALDAVRREAAAGGVRVVSPAAEPGKRNALLVLTGWTAAAEDLAEVSALPLRRQPIRSDGTWLAPWLLTRGVVDSTAGAIIPLRFDIRDEESLAYSQVLGRYLPEQAPTSAGFAGWLAGRRGATGPTRLYAASRTSAMPAQPGHPSHETTVSWFPGGTITPVGTALGSS
jgi:hypothetical protein